MQLPFERVSMIGLGYIGLPTAAILAGRGIEVVGVDVNPGVVETINSGRIHIVEPELDVLVRAAVQSGKLRALTRPEPADAFLVAVPTPFRDGHKPDLSYVESAAQSIAPALKAGDLVILESTSPVGTTEQMAEWLAQARPDLSFPQQVGETADVAVAHCPERVLPGHVLRELVENDRVIGGLTPRCAKRAASLYKTFVAGECVTTDARTAEMVKLTENTFRDVNIALANELSIICEKLQIDVWELISLANRHPRVNLLQPGPGVGGHCIAVDPWFIVDSAPEEARLIRTAREVNDGKPEHVLEQIRQAASRLDSPVIACLGLSFKADIDDLRESPALEIVQALAGSVGTSVYVVEPYVKRLPECFDGMGHVELADLDTALDRADVVVGLVNHKEFYAVDRNRLAQKVVIDTRGIWH